MVACEFEAILTRKNGTSAVELELRHSLQAANTDSAFSRLNHCEVGFKSTKVARGSSTKAGKTNQ